ncbi:glycoside hydrolase family 2 TIM barrel-domain containing protein [Flagellimonas sp. DF-77]|uniref:glycoside hydrolase family 2 protein n=1 Tax=Flagellimonas algarum TaxID=3230298 RepID=UPI0033921D21
MVLHLLTWSQNPAFNNIHQRNTTSLDGYWKIIIDPYENGFYNYRYEPFEDQERPSNNAFFTNYKPKAAHELVEYDFDTSDSLWVPGDWNTQKKKLLYYEGSIWVKKSFRYTKDKGDNRVFVHFGAANYRTDVYLNGKKLGAHEGGFTPFYFEVTDALRMGENHLIVKIDNTRLKQGVPTLNTDWWNYGGLTRSVLLVEVPQTFLQSYVLRLQDRETSTLQLEAQLSGPGAAGGELTVEIASLQMKRSFTADANGRVQAKFKLKGIEFWDVQTPNRYNVRFSTRGDSLSERIGFRTINVNGPEIELNGTPVFLKGISIHEERPIKGGRANSREDAIQLLSWAKDLGCNYVRLAHYAHNEHMVRVADSLGLMVWEEVPVYWTIDWEAPKTLANAQQQLLEMIHRDANRASVIIWSMANETPTSEARLAFLKSMAQTARTADPSRLISAALEQKSVANDPFTRTIEDPFADHVDILSFNQYIGWYDGLPDKCSKINWQISQDKPVVISEFGAGAKSGLHGDKNERWTEEYQAYLYEETLDMLDRNPKIRGMSPWLLVDFRSPRRMLPGIQDGWNRKGLISNMGQRKLAFYVLQEYYRNK